MADDDANGAAAPLPQRHLELELDLDLDVASSDRVETSVASPYVWDDNAPTIPPQTLEAWASLSRVFDEGGTVDWGTISQSCDAVRDYLSVSLEARTFCEKYMGSVAYLLAELDPNQLEQYDRVHLRTSMNAICALIALDLSIQVHRGGACTLLETALGRVFKHRDPFSATIRSRHERLVRIESFRNAGGFRNLHAYLKQRVKGTESDASSAVDGPFPTFETVNHVLEALLDSMVSTDNERRARNRRQRLHIQERQEEDAFYFSSIVAQRLNTLSIQDLDDMCQTLGTTLRLLQRIVDFLAATRPAENRKDFYNFWRLLVLKMIQGPSTAALQRVAWQQVHELIRATSQCRPPPRTVFCFGAGAKFCNGEYRFAGTFTPEGHVQAGTEYRYVRVLYDSSIDDDSSAEGSNDEDGDDMDDAEDDKPLSAPKELTLRRCSIDRKRWILSEANDEQPGSNREGTAYYAHGWSSTPEEADCIPLRGWQVCSAAGISPPPMITTAGVMVPREEECDTLDYQLARWIMDHKLFEALLDEATKERTTAHANHQALLSFMSLLCTRYRDIAMLMAQSLLDWYTRACDATGVQPFKSNLMDRIQQLHAHEGQYYTLETIVLEAFLDSTGGCAFPIPKEAWDVLLPKGEYGAVFAGRVCRLLLSMSVMAHWSALSVSSLAMIPDNLLSLTLHATERMSDCVSTDPSDFITRHHAYWRRLAFNMMASSSRQIQVMGWSQVADMTEAVIRRRPPPRSFVCTGAGAAICNGEYHFAGSVTKMGYIQPGSEIRYVQVVPTVPEDSTPPTETEEGQNGADGSTTKLALYRGLTQHEEKCWFLSEVNEQRSGTRYYACTSPEEHPPRQGWEGNGLPGVNPPPVLTPIGAMVPEGMELDTPELDLARWMIENKILRRLLVDPTLQEASTQHFERLSSFLTCVCKQDKEISRLLGISLADQYLQSNNM